jgi:hypothetical protein
MQPEKLTSDGTHTFKKLVLSAIIAADAELLRHGFFS